MKEIYFILLITSWSHFADFLNCLSPLLHFKHNEGQGKSVAPAVSLVLTHIMCSVTISLVDKWTWAQGVGQLENGLDNYTEVRKCWKFALNPKSAGKSCKDLSEQMEPMYF